MKYKVTVNPGGHVLELEEGTTYLEAQIKAGFHPDAPCGGQGTCGKCLVDVISPKGQVRTLKACAHKVEGDVILRVRDEGEVNILESGYKRKVALKSPVRKAPITVEKCAMGDNSSDWQRIKEACAQAFGIYISKIPVNRAILNKAYDVLEENDNKAVAVAYNEEIIDVVKDTRLYGAAVDIGTTTVVLYLMDLETGEELSHASMLNPQSQYGADVIARADYAIAHGSDVLSGVIREAINELIDEACAKAGADRNEIYLISLVGNTCMHHLFLGLTPKPLVKAPYNTLINDEIVMNARHAGLNLNPQARLQMLPNIAGFVGADTAGVLLAIEFDKIEKLTLAIDIGTNGELVLGNKDRMIACSTAAGPAFEGAKIEKGMRGKEGAIDHVKIDEDGSVACTVIGNEKPVGICGSGLMDAVAVFLDAGIIDETGKFAEPDEVNPINSGRFFTTKEGIKAFTLKGDVYLTQKDIREVQLAKGAIAAGIDLMAEELGVKISDIEEVMIAGAFGNYMDSKSACRIGMIPMELSNRITLIGNGAGEGAKIATLNYDEFKRAQKITESVKFLELATSAKFQDTYVDHLMFD